MTETTNLTVQERARNAITIGHTECELADLAAKTAYILEIKDDADYQLVKRSALNLGAVRIQIQKNGKAARDDANLFSKAVLEEERRLIRILSSEEYRLKALRKAVDDESARKKQEEIDKEEKRKADHSTAIALILEQAEGLIGAPIETMQARVEWLEANKPDDAFEEYYESAANAHSKSLSAIRAAINVRHDLDRRDAEQKAIADEQAKKQAELNRQAKAQEEKQGAIDAEAAKAARLKQKETNRRLAEEKEKAAQLKAKNNKLEAAAKKKRDDESREAAEKAERERIAAAAPDREKLKIYARQLLDVEPPEIDSPECLEILRKATATVKKIAELIDCYADQSTGKTTATIRS